MLETCNLLLGQLSDHPRLRVTIPHKAFEAAAMGKPYLTARAAGIQEFLVEGLEAEYFIPGDAADLLLHIQKLKKENEYREMLGENISQKYETMASEEAIGKNFLALLRRD
jgi:glycosyltransferase involved in cell wall biosynthesis